MNSTPAGQSWGSTAPFFHSRNQYSFVCARDMSFVERKFIEFMVSELNKNQEIGVLIPESGKGLEPLYPIYSTLFNNFV